MCGLFTSGVIAWAIFGLITPDGPVLIANLITALPAGLHPATQGVEPPATVLNRIPPLGRGGVLMHGSSRSPEHADTPVGWRACPCWRACKRMQRTTP